MKMKEKIFVIYLMGVTGTFIYFVVIDLMAEESPNWFFVIPVYLLQSTLWPIFWPVRLALGAI